MTAIIKVEMSHRLCLRTAIFTAIAAGLLFAASHALSQEGAVAGPNRDVMVETAMKIMAPFTVAAVGDIIELRPLYSSDPRFRELVDHFHKADIGFANMECSLIDFRSFHGPVASFEAPLETGDAMKAMGITLVSHANNHTFDGGLEGMFSTDNALDKLGIAHAGTGKDLQAARAAACQETPKGRVGLVGMSAVDDAYNRSKAEATYRNGDLGGAAGENVLHLTTYRVVRPDQLQQMRNIAATVYGQGIAPAAASPGGDPDRFKYFDQWFQAGSDPGSLKYEMNPKDKEDILASIRNGKVYADFMIATVHSHQLTMFSTAPVNEVEHNVTDFLIKLAHDSIDNGADMFVAHGVHALHAVEVYKGKPIFYGLSNFVFQWPLQLGPSNDVMTNWKRVARLENPVIQETILTTSHFESGKLKEVRLYPVDLGGSRRPISQIGIPLAAGPEDALRILKKMQDLSKPFGTRIEIENNVGVIRLTAAANGPASSR
jgi:poly-gamma-glutamate capsule biosynthesis protein CapA/YwtB (metallophosphatase superfamily)